MVSRSAGPTEGPTTTARWGFGRSAGAGRVDRPSDQASPRHRLVERARSAGQLGIRSQRRGDVHEVALTGELDLATAEAVEHELTAVEATDADRIILDLSGLDFIAGTGLHVILGADARCSADGSRLTLLRGPPQVQRMFEITATADRLPFD